MNFRVLSIAVISIFSSLNLLAQDKIIKRNGDIIDTKVKSVGRNMIIYLRFDNQNGPEYTIPKNEVNKIKYQNGTEQSFDGDEGRRVPPSIQERRAANELLKGKYKPSILAVAPIQFTENGLIGIGLSYERAIDKEDIVAFYLPFVLEFNSGNANSTYSGDPNNPDPMFYLMPGLKIYPTGGYGLAKYAIGPSFVIADGQKTTSSYDPIAGNKFTVGSHFLIGMMVNQSLNINPTPRLYIGAELGLGMTYIDRIAGVNQVVQPLVQFGFKIGYRY